MAIEPRDIFNAIAGPQEEIHETLDRTKVYEGNAGITDRNRSRDLQDTAIQQVTQLAIQRNRTGGFVDGALGPLLIQAREAIWEAEYREARGFWLFPRLSVAEASRVAHERTSAAIERLASAVSLTHRNLSGAQELENTVFTELCRLARFGFRRGDPVPPGAQHGGGGA